MNNNETRSCPRCSGQALTLYPVEGVEVDFCSSCNGIFCDPGEMDRLLGGDVDPGLFPLPFGEAGSGSPVCPACRGGMISLPVRTRDPKEGVDLLSCTSCRGLWLDGGTLQILRRESMRRRRERGPAPRIRPREEPAPVELDDQLAYDLPKVNLLALPAAFLFGLLVSPFGILLWPFSMTVHELGHTFTAWLAGIPAAPILILAFTWTSGSRNFFLSLLIAAGLTYLIRLGWQEKYRIFTAVMSGLFLLQIYLTLFIDFEQAEMWMVFGGLGMEILGSTFFICAFYYQAPKRLRWDFWRYIFLFPFAACLVEQVSLWKRVRADDALLQIIAGSNMNGSRDGSSDVDRLSRIYGWGDDGVLTVYGTLTLFCCLVVLIHYLVFLFRAYSIASPPTSERV